jgi:hypothetical protein
VEKYLAASLPGVGPGRAALLVKEFGSSTLEVLDAADAMARLLKVWGCCCCWAAAGLLDRCCAAGHAGHAGLRLVL